MTIGVPTTNDWRPGLEQALTGAEDRWRAGGIDSYGFLVRRQCFCVGRGPYRVTVIDGLVTDISGVDAELAVGLMLTTVPDLFALARSGLDGDRLEVDFQPDTGVPLRIAIDRSQRAVDDEITVEVSEFSILGR